MTTDLLSGLNPRQREAVSAGAGPVLVLAGPGSGKTRVLTHRIAYLIQDMNIYPNHIVAVTFTNKAAAEMRARAEKLLENASDGLQIGTFHSICARLLRIEADHTPYQRDYVIYDTDDQLTIMKNVLNELNIDLKKFPPSRILYAISAAKNELITSENYISSDYFGEMVARAYPLYQSRMIQNNAVDFDDLLMQTVILLRDNEGVRQKYQRRYEHILVDEFQDTNFAQYSMVKILAGFHGNMFVVGDEDQSIYAFRGADYRNVNGFLTDYPDARVVLLEQNYRSTQVVLDVAKAIIDRNTNRTPKKLFTDKVGGSPVIIHEAYSESEEGEWVVDKIRSMMRLEGYTYRDFAVMYRINAQSRAMEDGFKVRGVPYRIVGGVGFYQRREVRDLVAYLRVVNNPGDSVALNRIINTPRRGIGDKTVTDFHAWVEGRGGDYATAIDEIAHSTVNPMSGRAGKAMAEFAKMIRDLRLIAFPGDETPTDLAMLFDEIMARTGYSLYLTEISDTPEQITDRMENLRALRGLLDSKKDLALDDFLADVSLNVDVEAVADAGERSHNSVTLLTLHAAKGLEYPVVFITGVEDGILPHSRSIESGEKEEMAEERRLFYVGLTRAREHLFLTYAFRRSLYGESIPSIVSRFMGDIPQNLTEGAPTSVKHISERQAYQDMTRWESDERHEKAAPAPRPRANAALAKSKSKIIPFTKAAEIVPSPPTYTLKHKIGQRVLHLVYGEGVIVNVRRSGQDEELSVSFSQPPAIKTLMASFAKLRVLE